MTRTGAPLARAQGAVFHAKGPAGIPPCARAARPVSVPDARPRPLAEARFDAADPRAPTGCRYWLGGGCAAAERSPPPTVTRFRPVRRRVSPAIQTGPASLSTLDGTGTHQGAEQ
jgi:hypothetical protein